MEAVQFIIGEFAMIKHSLIWVFFRLIVFGMVLLSVLAYGKSMTANIGPVAIFLIASVSGLALYLWLVVARSRLHADWTCPFSYDKPFWPMRRYPVRYWMVIAEALIFAGIVGLVASCDGGGKCSIVSLFMVSLGVGVLAAIAFLVFFHGKKPS